MRILLTGANGYIGSQLLAALIHHKHEIVALVRSLKRLYIPEEIKDKVKVIEGDLLDRESLDKIPRDIDAAYYLVHSMGRGYNFYVDEEKAALNFYDALKNTRCQQLIYLGGISRGIHISMHMRSRKNVERILCGGEIPYTILSAAIIIGSGSASFEIIRDLVEKLPVMIAPKWVESRCQPISIRDVIFYLTRILGNKSCMNVKFEIGGPDQLTYGEILKNFARARGLKRLIIPIPFLSPRLSSYWLFFVTATNFSLAKALVESLKKDAVCIDNTIDTIIPHKCLSYMESLGKAFSKIEQHAVFTSWKGALVLSRLNPDLMQYARIPKYGCHKLRCIYSYSDRKRAIEKLWTIGGDNGWYFMNFAWKIRGLFDRMIGGIGIRRGRIHPRILNHGDILDFWRVILSKKDDGHLLLYGEMKMPGEVWLEYRIDKGVIKQTTVFRAKGILGRIYWYLFYPIHIVLFRGLCKSIAQDK